MRSTELTIRDVEFEMLWEFYNEIAEDSSYNLLVENISKDDTYVVSAFKQSSVEEPKIGDDYYFMTVHWIPQSIMDGGTKIIKAQYSTDSFKLSKINSTNLTMSDSDRQFSLPTLVTNYCGVRAFTVLLNNHSDVEQMIGPLTQIRFSKSAGWDLRIAEWKPHAGTYL